MFGKISTYGWVNRFLTRHRDQLEAGTVYRQEDPRLEIPRVFLNQYLDLVSEQIVGLKAHLVFNIDETGCSDWEERKEFDAIIPTSLHAGRVHFAVTPKVKHQTMLVCVSADGDALCPLIATSDRSTLGVFRDGIEPNVHLRVRVGRSAYVDKVIFHDYIRDVLVPKIENIRATVATPDAPAALLMDNCSTHLGEETIRLLTDANVRVPTFPPHTSGIFQMLDLVFFGVFKRAKKRIPRDPTLPLMQDHARRMLMAFESAVTSFTIRGSFGRAGIVCVMTSNQTYVIGFDETRVRESPGFREVWDIDFPLARVSSRRQSSHWGFLNPSSG
jgi:hypothetical protein